MEFIVKFLPLFVGLFSTIMSSGGVFATSHLPSISASIQEVDGAPAACVPHGNGKDVQLQRAYVMEDSRGRGYASHQWIIELIPGNKPMTLHPDECLVFGKSIGGYQETGGLKKLEEGKTYIFVLERGDLQHWGPINYVGAFCVMRLPNGRLAHLPYVDHPNETTTYPPCARRRIAGPPAPDGIAPPEIRRP